MKLDLKNIARLAAIVAVSGVAFQAIATYTGMHPLLQFGLGGVNGTVASLWSMYRWPIFK